MGNIRLDDASVLEQCGKPVNRFKWRHLKPMKMSKETRENCRFNVMLSHNSIGRVNQQTPRQFAAYEIEDQKAWIHCIELVKALNRRRNEIETLSEEISQNIKEKIESDEMVDQNAIIRNREGLIPPEKISCTI